MSKSKSKQEAPVAYRYSPGDGHTYTWDGGEYATVYRHEKGRASGPGPESFIVLVPTGDHVYMGDCPRTAGAMADRIKAWVHTMTVVST